jgi:hyperosmotically inducible protein
MTLVCGNQAVRGNAAAPSAARAQQNLERQVGKELRKLPDFSVFDNLEFRVRGYRVELYGQVIHGSLKSTAERAVQRIEGVEAVENHIEILPASVNDDRLRQALLQSIYSRPPLQRYAVQAVPPVHIIVNRGHVILAGVVANQSEKDTAYVLASAVPGSFSVTNRLHIED